MIKKLFLSDKFILTLILINSLIIFFSGFSIAEELKHAFAIIDNLITVLFIVELLVKLKVYRSAYFLSGWNKLDFVLVILSIPALVSFITHFSGSGLSVLLIFRAFRVFRVFKTIRFIKFIPGIESLLKGVIRALKTSIIALFGFMVYVFIVGIFSYYMFADYSTDFFGDPLKALYATFKVFTVEGWFEIPEKITATMNQTTAFFTYLYFIFVLLTGGIIGLSLVNSIFVDAMVSDNNDELEAKIDALNQKISIFIDSQNENKN